jgi:hypothetical protein
MILLASAESVVSLSHKMMAKFEILEIGNVEGHCLLFLNRSARQVQERVADHEQMTVHAQMVSEIEDLRLQLGVKADRRAPRMALDLQDVNFKNVLLLSVLLLQQSKIISGALR